MKVSSKQQLKPILIQISLSLSSSRVVSHYVDAVLNILSDIKSITSRRNNMGLIFLQKKIQRNFFLLFLQIKISIYLSFSANAILRTD